MEEIIVTDHFYERFCERLGLSRLNKHDLVEIIKEIPVENILGPSEDKESFYAKINLKKINYFVVYKYDNDNLILLSLLDEEIFLDKRRREFISLIYKQIPQTKVKRRMQLGSYRKDPFAKTKNGRRFSVDDYI